ncbi:MAG: hypothetical protein WCE73_06850, partial [Candidatus Angelobacter sp.]
MLPHAIIYLLSAAFAVVILRRFIYGFSERTLRDVVAFIRHLALEDLQNLLHPEVEDHLRRTISQHQFKRTQWKRIRLTLQYLRDLGENAATLYAWGKHERKLSIRFPDPERKRASVDLITASVQLRFCSFRMRVTLHCWLTRMAFLPFLAPPSFRRLERNGSFDVFLFYDQVKRAAGELSMAYGQRFYDELLQVL